MARDFERELKIAYCAGIIDGEGAVVMRIRGRAIDYTLQVMMIDKEPLLELQKLYKGNINKYQSRNPKHSDTYRWAIWGNQARKALEEMLPFLKIKKKKAELLIEIDKLGTFNRWNLTEEVTSKRITLIGKYKDLFRQRKNNRWKGAD